MPRIDDYYREEDLNRMKELSFRVNKKNDVIYKQEPKMRFIKMPEAITHPKFIEDAVQALSEQGFKHPEDRIGTMLFVFSVMGLSTHGKTSGDLCGFCDLTVQQLEDKPGIPSRVERYIRALESLGMVHVLDVRPIGAKYIRKIYYPVPDFDKEQYRRKTVEELSKERSEKVMEKIYIQDESIKILKSSEAKKIGKVKNASATLKVKKPKMDISARKVNDPDVALKDTEEISNAVAQNGYSWF